MGNHEFCERCGLNDFHDNADCDPARVARVEEIDEELKRRNKERTAVAERVLTEAGVPFRKETDRWGYTHIHV